MDAVNFNTKYPPIHERGPSDGNDEFFVHNRGDQYSLSYLMGIIDRLCLNKKNLPAFTPGGFL
jgi:hypothetical protein